MVSPQRTQRPWLGQVEKLAVDKRPAFDPGCYLCPGNPRAGGARNSSYDTTYVFTNDFSALLPEAPGVVEDRHFLLQAQGSPGTCRVMCFSPRHDLTLAEMEPVEIRQVVEVWASQTSELGAVYPWVQVFENKGEIMGCSNPHPHGQIWASQILPNEPAKEDFQQRVYWRQFKQRLLVDYAALEAEIDERVVAANEDWLVVTPYWAVWPFELLLLPRRPVLRLPELIPEQRDTLALILKETLVRYDNLFEVSFPYSMGWHGAPFGSDEVDHWQLHAHFYPPLLRSAKVKKFMVGYEMLSEPQRDLTPEQAAARLRALSAEHYKKLL